MAQQSVGLFGLRLIPGEEHDLDVYGDVRITNISLGEEVVGSARSVVRIHHKSVPAFDDSDEDESSDEDVSDNAKQASKPANGVEKHEEIEEEEETFVVCSLYPGRIEQANVDLHISAEDQVRFSVSGENTVEILGNYLSPGSFDSDPDSDELIDDDDESIDSDLYGLDSDSDGDIELLEDDEEDYESDSEGRIQEIVDEKNDTKKSAKSTDLSKKRSAEAAAIDEEDDDDTGVTDAEVAKAAKEIGVDMSKLTKNQRKKLNKKLRQSDEDQSMELSKEEVKVVKKDENNGKTKSQAAAVEIAKKDGKVASKKVTLPSGVQIEDVAVGSGPQAKKGSRLGMRYIGRLQGGKQFDANTKGKPFTFKLGAGEVIQGWDVGLVGMKVGGERRLTIPPKLGYGSRGVPGIPGNSTLIFDVKLVEVK